MSIHAWQKSQMANCHGPGQEAAAKMEKASPPQEKEKVLFSFKKGEAEKSVHHCHERPVSLDSRGAFSHIAFPGQLILIAGSSFRCMNRTHGTHSVNRTEGIRGVKRNPRNPQYEQDPGHS